ncbi:MAG: non-hydrolyzing UDP-N-acetylglucosamine 2-epimerase [bacterium]
MGKKIVTVLGARPQFIKAATVSRELKRRGNFKEIIVHTGQHFDSNMSDIFFRQMEIPVPDYNLAINGLSHGAMTGKMIAAIEEILLEVKPDWVLVYGDTNSTLAGALAAAKLHINVAHVEAGLRSFNMRMPEEINRILTDRVSTLLFSPTETAISNLTREGFESINHKLINSGDVMFDAALFYNEKSLKPALDIPGKFVLVTIHRAENTDDSSRLTSIIEALKEISREIPVVIPLHPRTRKIMEKLNINLSSNHIHLIEPVGYLEMVYLLNNASLVMTDSGGLQKEAFFFKKPCITLRDETEWVELIELGVNSLGGSEMQRIISLYEESKNKRYNFEVNLYGKGDAAQNIVKEIEVFA